jgi:hypothetical protein
MLSFHGRYVTGTARIRPRLALSLECSGCARTIRAPENAFNRSAIHAPWLCSLDLPSAPEPRETKAGVIDPARPANLQKCWSARPRLEHWGHTVTGDGSECVDGIVRDYLVNLALPAEGAVYSVPPLPPAPTE